jgi:hypothetical protein
MFSFRHRAAFGLGLILCAAPVWAQAPAEAPPRAGQAELSLRKSIYTRQYQGREIQGEERPIGPGDSLWRILVEERGLSGKQFRSYLVVIRGLNPEIKNLDVLRVGDKIFIPLRTDGWVEGKPATPVASGQPPPAGRGTTVDYRVKPGEHLYQILREQLKLTDERKVAQYYALVKDLNPERKNWDTLLEGEVIRLPTAGGPQVTGAPAAAAPVEARPSASAAAVSRPPMAVTEGSRSATPQLAPAVTTIEPRAAKEPPQVAASPTPDRRRVLKEPAKDNMTLFAAVVEAIGGQLQRNGEETVVLKEGTVRFDKEAYPVVYSPSLGQKVVIDPEEKIPPSLRAKLSDGNVGAQILPISSTLSVQEAVGQLLARLGYQSLPADRPVIVQEEGIAYEAKGNWVALAPEQSNRTQDLLVINLVEGAGEIPEYLKTRLARRGLQLRDVGLNSPNELRPVSAPSELPKDFAGQIRNWPRDKREMLDSLLLSLRVPFGVGEAISVDLGGGIRVDTQTDRIFEQSGKKTALFFHRIDPVIKKALQEKHGVRTVEIEIHSLSSRDVIGKVLNMLGDQASYREHRFPAANGAAGDRLTVAAWGFHLPERSMFLTDRQIPSALHRFFFEKGLEIVYFQ